jgi:hypothetical protein
MLMVLGFRSLLRRLCADKTLVDESLYDVLLYKLPEFMPFWCWSTLLWDLREEACLELVQPIIIEING